MDKDVKQALETVASYMRNQMYGAEQTKWTNGNEHDEMYSCLSLIEGLINNADEDEEK